MTTNGTCWLLADDVARMRAARAFSARVLARGGGRERPKVWRLDAATGTATIRVDGVLTPVPDAEAEWYGEANTTYPELQVALAAARADERTREIVWSIDSPGGAVDGLFALLDDIADARAAGGPPMRVLAENAHSAAYGIAAAVGPISAASRMSSFGSVGVATSAFVLGDMIGRTINLTNTDAPEKRPDLKTEAGQAVVVRYLDQIGGEFMTAIARGRGVDVETVREKYGRGASMLAPYALEAGIIDAIASRPAAASAAIRVETEEQPTMNEAEKAELEALRAKAAKADQLSAALDIATAATKAARIDALVFEGKLVPGQREWAAGLSLEGLEAFAKSAPVLAPKASAPVAPAVAAPALPAELTADELAVCRSMGVDPVAYKAMRDAQAGKNAEERAAATIRRAN